MSIKVNLIKFRDTRISCRAKFGGYKVKNLGVFMKVFETLLFNHIITVEAIGLYSTDPSDHHATATFS
jgi:hypothetical protein